MTHHNQTKELTTWFLRFCFGLTTITQNSADRKWCRIQKMQNMKAIENFETFSKKKYAPIQPTV
jgi:hypothetical protein